MSVERSLIRVQEKQADSKRDYKCCFCRHFQLERFRWGHCKILNVEVKGNSPACSLAEPFFPCSQNQKNT